MARFSQVEINALFFEGETGEYYRKMDEVSSTVYDMDNKCDFTDTDGSILISIFPENHQVEDI